MTAMFDLADHGSGDPKFFSKIALCIRAFFNQERFFKSEFLYSFLPRWVIHSGWQVMRFVSRVSPFNCFILHIVCLTAKEQMRRIYTCWVVAGMKNINTNGNRTVSYLK